VRRRRIERRERGAGSSAALRAQLRFQMGLPPAPGERELLAGRGRAIRGAGRSVPAALAVLHECSDRANRLVLSSRSGVTAG
jgi:hypothetical protein